jgi:hypothetical protein
MEYCYFPKNVEQNRSEDIRVIDGWEVGLEYKFVVQTKAVFGGMAEVKPDWVSGPGFEELKDAIAYTFRFFPPYTTTKKLTTEELKNQISNGNDLIKVTICVDGDIIHYDFKEYLNDILTYNVLDDELEEHDVYLTASSYELVGVEPLYNDLILLVECKVLDPDKFL